MKTKLQIVKIGGNIIDDEKLLADFLSDFSKIDDLKILVHGGGKLASKMNDKLGIETVMNEGRRITSQENLEVVTMIYGGLISKKITAKLQANSCNAIGISGADGNCILAKKRPVKSIDFGFVGDIESVNTSVISTFLNNNIVPIFSAICHDGNGQLLNTNADTIASEIAIAMSNIYETELIYCFEKNGVLKDVSDENSVIRHIDNAAYKTLKTEKVISEGMLPKLENCFYALNNKVQKVSIGNQKMITDNNSICTTITL